MGLKEFLGLAIIFGSGILFGRPFPVYDGLLTSDLNAGGYSITNLNAGFIGDIGGVATSAFTSHTNAVNPHEITAESLGALTAEADTLATVTARGATTTEAVTIGSRRVGAVGMSSLANGESVVASGPCSHAEGDGTTASGPCSHAEGDGTTASGYYSHAEGDGTTASGYYSHAEGGNTTASGSYSHAEGMYTTASGSYSHAEGIDTTASGYYSHAEGAGTTASGDVSHASGFNAVASNTTAFAWQGAASDQFAEPEYGSHGNGTFNINPVGGASGFWIGEFTLATLLGNVEAQIPSEDVITNVVHDVASSLIGAPYVLQGSTVVPTQNYTATFSGVAQDGGGGIIHIMPQVMTRPSEAASTGILHIATSPDSYIVDIQGDMYVTQVTQAEAADASRDIHPVLWLSERVDPTNWVIKAWVPGGTKVKDPAPGEGYYARLENLVVQTFDRPGYTPLAMTNDTAALPTFTDSARITTAPERLVTTAGSVKNYVDERKDEIAKSAWRWTPSGKASPSGQTVTLDLPLVQQGQIAYLQSGNYFILSYEGGDWRSSSEGSHWQIGAGGRADLTITSEGRMAHIRDFAVDTAAGIATIYASTNWMTGAAGSEPYVEWSPSLDDPQWLAEQNCVRTHHVDAVNGDYWMFVCPATADQRFFRVVIPGGERRIISTPTHRFEGGVEFGGNLYNIITITNGTERYEVLGRRL